VIGVGEGQDRTASVTEALDMLHRALDHLNAADAASLPASVQAEALRALERTGAKHTAARARVLGAFAGQAAYEDDGQGSARTWLKWQTCVTAGAAAGAVGWVRRLTAHPVIGAALAAGELSESWARQVCLWTDRLPAREQDGADEILAAAARAGVDLAGLAGLAQEIYERLHRDPDGGDAGDGFADRALYLATTLGGVGRLTGDLTAGCSAALAAVLEALGKRAGPEDLRSPAQRRHDALEEACRRLVASGMLPGRGGQPTQIHVHMSLSQLRDLPGASAAEAAWAAAKTGQPGWLTGPEAEAAACDASVVPIVTGHIDGAALDELTDLYRTHMSPASSAAGASGVGGLAGRATHKPSQTGEAGCPAGRGPGGTTHAPPASPVAGASGVGGLAGRAAHKPSQTGGPGCPGGQDPCCVTDDLIGAVGLADGIVGHADGAAGHADGVAGHGSHHGGRPGSATGHGDCTGAGCGCQQGRCDIGASEPLSPHSRRRLRRALLALATDALSGPGGLAAQLRAGLDGPIASVSLPLDVGPATETIPAHLRRAVTTRHPHCAFPGCGQPASVCDIHHIIPRSRGGSTSLDNLLTLCTFHHKIVVHRWGWALRLNADGTTTATSPYGKVLHSHSPPGQAA
jgi:Domain of unknown function (DUF222)/HNH endonuclease